MFPPRDRPILQPAIDPARTQTVSLSRHVCTELVLRARHPIANSRNPRLLFFREVLLRVQIWLERADQICRLNESELRVVVFPFLHNLGSDYPFRTAHQQLVEFCENKNMRVLDLEPVLATRAASDLTVNRFDAHPNELAHELAAKAIRSELLSDFD